MLTIWNQTRRELLATGVRVCERFLDRMTGLIGRPRMGLGEACWIIPCKAVHTIGMTYPVDLYFLDERNCVIGVLKEVQPMRFTPVFLNARSVLEFRSGVDRYCRIGDQIHLEPK